MAKRKTASTARGVTLRIRKGKMMDSIQLDVVEDGKRTRENLGLYLTGDRDKDRETLLLAEQIRAKRLRERTLRNAGIAEISFRPEEDFLNFYDALMERKGKPWRNLRSHITAFVKNTRPRFADITEQWLSGFRDHLNGKKLAQNTIASYLDVLKTALNIAVRQKVISVNPFVYMDPIRRSRTQREYLTVEELVALSAAPCAFPEVRRPFLFACLTGLRISDLKALTWKNVRPDGIRFTQKKTGDVTVIPLATQAREILGEQGKAKAGDHVFDFPYGEDVFNQRLLRWVKSAGIEKHVTSHTARHTFATMLITQGNDLYSVQHLLGHRDIKVTQIYAKLVDARKQSAIASLPKLITR